MTVAELIEELKQHNPEAKVYLPLYLGDGEGAALGTADLNRVDRFDTEQDGPGLILLD